MKTMKKAVALSVMVLLGIGPAFAEVGQRWVSMAISQTQSYAVDEDGVLWGWDMVSQPDPVVLDASGGWTDLNAFTSGSHGLVGIRDGNIYRIDGLTAPVQQTVSGDWESIRPAASHTVALKEDGTLWTWGDNFHGQLGTGNTTASATPLQVQPGQTFASFSTSLQNSAAVRADGSLWITGQNAYGETGTGAAGSDVLSWTQVTHPSGGVWKSVSIGTTTDTLLGLFGTRTSVLALDANGALYAWGGTDNGKAGDGSMFPDNLQTPIKVSDGPFAKIWSAAGGTESYALTADGKLYGWGLPVNGVTVYVPTLIADNVADAAVGTVYNALWKTSGEVLHWTTSNIASQNMTPDLLSTTTPTLTSSWSFIFPSLPVTVASAFPDGSPFDMQPNHIYLQLNN